MPTSHINMGSYAEPRSGTDVKIGSYAERLDSSSGKDRYNSEDSMEDNNSNNSSLDSAARQQDFQKKEHEFIPTRASGILASKPAVNPGQFTRVNSNPLLISAQKQLILVEQAKKKKQELLNQPVIGDETPEWQSELDNWKHRRRKQSEEALSRVAEYRRAEDLEFENGGEKRKWSLGKKISGYLIDDDDEIDLGDLPSADESPSPIKEASPASPHPSHSPTPPTIKQAPPKAQHQNNFEKDSERTTSPDTDRDSAASGSISSGQQQDRDSAASGNNSRSQGGGGNPYQTAIEGYKSFAQTALSTSDKNEYWESALTHSRYPTGEGLTQITVKETSAKNETQTSQQNNYKEDKYETQRSSSGHDQADRATSGQRSHSPVVLHERERPDKSNSPRYKAEMANKSEEWESTIESITQPIRKPSSDNISDKMKMKLAKFAAADGQDADKDGGGQTAAARVIQPDNSFKDKLKAFKTIESTATSTGSTSIGGGPVVGGLGRRRESEPQLPRGQEVKTSRSTSSSALLSNNKFFQQDRIQEKSESTQSISSTSNIKTSSVRSSSSLSNRSSFNSFTGGLTATGPASLKDETALSVTAASNGGSAAPNKVATVDRIDSLRSEVSEVSDGGQLLEDALEESFNQLEDNKKLVFRAEDFVPSTERLAPPADKPPPLPAPSPPEDVSEEAIAKQEREIIESIEREEREFNQSKKKSEPSINNNNNITSGAATTNLVNKETSSSVQHHKKSTNSDSTKSTSSSMMTNHYAASSATTTNQSINYTTEQHNGGEMSHSRSASALYTQEQPGYAATGYGRSESTSALPKQQPRGAVLPGAAGGEHVRREKDYNKHWLIQEAEQRRIAEAKQKQFEAGSAKINNKSLSGSNIPKPQPPVGAAPSPYASLPQQQQNYVNQSAPAVGHNGRQQPPIPGGRIPSGGANFSAPVSNQVNNRGGPQPQAQNRITAQQQPPVNNYNNKAQPPQFTTNNQPRGGGAFNNTDNYVNVAAAATAAASEKSYIGGGGHMIAGSSSHGYGDLQENIYANVDPDQQYLNRTSSSLPPGGEMHAPSGPRGGSIPPQQSAGPHLPPRTSTTAAGVGGTAGTNQDRVLSVSGKKKCSACREELGRGAAMIIETLRLFYHIRCFNCCVCSVQLGNGEQGTDVRVRNNRLHCQNCYSNDEGLKFSKV